MSLTDGNITFAFKNYALNAQVSYSVADNLILSREYWKDPISRRRVQILSTSVVVSIILPGGTRTNGPFQTQHVSLVNPSLSPAGTCLIESSENGISYSEVANFPAEAKEADSDLNEGELDVGGIDGYQTPDERQPDRMPKKAKLLSSPNTDRYWQMTLTDTVGTIAFSHLELSPIIGPRINMGNFQENPTNPPTVRTSKRGVDWINARTPVNEYGFELPQLDHDEVYPTLKYWFDQVGQIHPVSVWFFPDPTRNSRMTETLHVYGRVATSPKWAVADQLAEYWKSGPIVIRER